MATKTPVMILQELMVKKQENPPHFTTLAPDVSGLFECKATSMGVSVTGRGRCKKDAKQDAAKLILLKFSEMGIYFPGQCDNLSPPTHAAVPIADVIINHVGVLKDLCCDFKLGEPEFILLDETGLPHAKQFTIQCTVGSLSRTATSSTKKQAKQMAAGLLYKFYSENMPERLSEYAENNESSTLSNLNEIAIEKYLDAVDTLWRPNLGQKIANYHLGLKEIIDEPTVQEALTFLKDCNELLDPLSAVDDLLKILNLEYEWTSLESTDDKVLCLLKIPHANPPAFFSVSGIDETHSKKLTAVDALEYFSILLII